MNPIAVDKSLANLKWGDTVVLTDDYGSHPLLTKLVGISAGRGIIVSPPDQLGIHALSDGRALKFRGFTPRNMLSFNTRVVEKQDSPFPHWHLMYPDSVEVTGNRRYNRVRSELLASVSGRKYTEKSVPVFVTNISEGGCRVRTRQKLGSPGEILRFEMWLDQLSIGSGELVVSAEIRGHSDVYGYSRLGDFHPGYHLCFTNLSEKSRLMLRAILYAVDEKEEKNTLDDLPAMETQIAL